MFVVFKLLESFVKKIESVGAGEILLTSIDAEGLQEGVDIDLYTKIENLIDIPIIASGGIGNLNHMINFFDITNCSSVACGSLFVFYGKRNAVLVNYPTQKEIEFLMEKYE